MAVDIDNVTKMLTLLERIINMQGQGTLSTALAEGAKKKITEALEAIFPPIEPPPFP